MRHVILWLVVLAPVLSSPAAEKTTADMAKIERLRHEGQLAEARALAEQVLAAGVLSPDEEVDCRLEMARILDRIGLHENTRPVTEALRQIEVAAGKAAELRPIDRAKVELARADYHYRAEMGEREFPLATLHADRASELFRKIGDQHGEADAVHKLALIHFQRREFETARQLFDRSLDLDQAAGERPYFRGDFERHVGLIHYLEGDLKGSIPFFERSLTYRRQGRFFDASLFAANTLASILIRLGRHSEATPHLLYAMMLAERLDSPFGRAHTGLVAGRLYEQSGDVDAARLAHEMALRTAESIGTESVIRESRSALERLAAAESVCPAIANLGAVVESDRQVILLGEIHGTAEMPAFVDRLVCHLLDAGRAVTVGFEWPQEERARVDGFLESAGDAGDRRALLGGEMWRRAYQDGRNSIAMLELLDRLRQRRKSGAPVEALLYDADQTSANRDQLMGRRLAQAIGAEPDRYFVILSGNYHNRIRKGAPWNPDFVPMAFELAPDSFLSLDVSQPAGTAWICTGSGPESCGERGIGGEEGTDGPAIELYRNGEERTYHGVVRLPSATASLPAGRP